jgi:hypothetical protein
MDENKMKEAVAAVLKSQDREALAQLIVEYVQPNHITTDFIGMLLNVKNLKLGDALVKKVRSGLKVRTWVPGSNSLKQEITVDDRVTYMLDRAIVSVLANEWDLESGEIGTVESIRAEAMASLKDYYLNKVFTALTSVWTAGNTPDNYTDCGAAVTQTALEDMIGVINDNTTGAKAIMGVRSALAPILKFGAFWDNGEASPSYWGIPEHIMEIMRTGLLGKYMGVPIITVNQIYDNPRDHNALLPTNKILVIGENVGDFITYGPEKTKEWTDNEPTPPYWHMDIVQQFGMVLDNIQGLGVLEID